LTSAPEEPRDLEMYSSALSEIGSPSAIPTLAAAWTPGDSIVASDLLVLHVVNGLDHPRLAEWRALVQAQDARMADLGRSLPFSLDDAGPPCPPRRPPVRRRSPAPSSAGPPLLRSPNPSPNAKSTAGGAKCTPVKFAALRWPPPRPSPVAKGGPGHTVCEQLACSCTRQPRRPASDPAASTPPTDPR
jgi:hypothetical protein